MLLQALSVAVVHGRVEVVMKLLQLGADKTIRSKSDKSPFDQAVFFKHRQVSLTHLQLVSGQQL